MRQYSIVLKRSRNCQLHLELFNELSNVFHAACRRAVQAQIKVQGMDGVETLLHTFLPITATLLLRIIACSERFSIFFEMCRKTKPRFGTSLHSRTNIDTVYQNRKLAIVISRWLIHCRQ